MHSAHAAAVCALLAGVKPIIAGNSTTTARANRLMTRLPDYGRT